MLFIVVCQRAEFNVDRHGSSDCVPIPGGHSRSSSSSSPPSSSSSWILAARGIRAGRRVAPSAVCVSRLTGFWGHEVGSLGHGERQLCIVPRQTRAHQSRRGQRGSVVIADLGHVWSHSSPGRIPQRSWNHVRVGSGEATAAQRKARQQSQRMVKRGGGRRSSVILVG